jgi:hypothetical protein
VKKLTVIAIAVGLTLVSAASAQAAQILDRDVAYNAFPAYAQARERNLDPVRLGIGARPSQGISFRWEIVCGNGWDRWKSGRVRTASKVWVVHPPLHTRCYMNVTAALVDQTGTAIATISAN